MRDRLLLLSLSLLTFSPGFAQDADSTGATLLGIWWSPDLYQSAAFQISDSTIFYPDALEEFSYSMVGDSLFVYRDDGIAASRIVSLTPETLILSSWGRLHRYSRSESKEKP